MMIGEFSGRGGLLLELSPMWGIPGEDRYDAVVINDVNVLD